MRRGRGEFLEFWPESRYPLQRFALPFLSGLGLHQQDNHLDKFSFCWDQKKQAQIALSTHKFLNLGTTTFSTEKEVQSPIQNEVKKSVRDRNGKTGRSKATEDLQWIARPVTK